MRRHIPKIMVRNADGVVVLFWSGGRAERVWTAHVPSLHKTAAEALVESLRNMETGGVGGGS